MRLSTDRAPRFIPSVWGYEPPIDMSIRQRYFVAYFFFVAWDCLSLGVHISLAQPNIEIHIPFGFFRIGWVLR
jgi:hypothetical protein